MLWHVIDGRTDGQTDATSAKCGRLMDDAEKCAPGTMIGYVYHSTVLLLSARFVTRDEFATPIKLHRHYVSYTNRSCRISQKNA